MRGVHKLSSDGEYRASRQWSQHTHHTLINRNRVEVSGYLPRPVYWPSLLIRLAVFPLAPCFVVGCWKGTVSRVKWKKKRNWQYVQYDAHHGKSFIQEWVERKIHESYQHPELIHLLILIIVVTPLCCQVFSFRTTEMAYFCLNSASDLFATGWIAGYESLFLLPVFSTSFYIDLPPSTVQYSIHITIRCPTLPVNLLLDFHSWTTPRYLN